MKMQWSLILGLVFALLTAVFAVINVDPVSVNLLFSTVSMPLILLIIGCTLLGGIIVGSYGIYRQYRLQREVKALSAKLAQYQELYGDLNTTNLTGESSVAEESATQKDYESNTDDLSAPSDELGKDKL